MSTTGTEPSAGASAPRPRPVEPPTQPGWMTVLAVLCATTFAIAVVRDLFVPAARDVEVWLGLEVTGPFALATAPLHWALFAVGAWAFWTGRTWVVPWAAGYLFYVAASHLVWSEASPHGHGWRIGLVQATVISALAYLLLRLRALDVHT